MKKIINGRKYDTETAKEMGCYCNRYTPRDFNYLEETLYRKRTGEYFIHGIGGAYSKYCRYFGTNQSGGEAIIPVTEEEARKWAEKNLECEGYEKIFGKVEE